MNAFLWVVQGLLAVHTLAGALWKLTNSEAMVPSLSQLPHGVWMALAVVEVLCVIGLLLPVFKRQFAITVLVSAAAIAAEMFLFCAAALASGQAQTGELVYWLIVASICAFVVYGRTYLRPLKAQ